MTKKLSWFVLLSAFAALLMVSAVSTLAEQERGAAAPAGQTAPPPRQPGHGMAKLVIWGDLALFERPGPRAASP